MKRALISVLAVGLAAACVDKSVPADAPPYAAVYPGASQVASVTVMDVHSITFRVPDTAEKVVGYYRIQATSNGLQEVPVTDPGPPGQQRASFSDSASHRKFTVLAVPKKGATWVSLIYMSPHRATS